MDRRSYRAYEGEGGTHRGRDTVRWEETPEDEDDTRGPEERRPPSRGGGEEKKGLYGRATGWVARHPAAALAAIIVLLLLVCVLVAMNRGAFGGRRGEGLGRREGPALPPGAAAKRGPPPASAHPHPPPDEGGDPETEALIASINSKQGL